MATVPINNIIRQGAARSLFESAKHIIGAASDINQGDLVALVGGVMVPVSAQNQIANLLGVAKQTLVDGKVKSPYQGTAVDASAALEDVCGPVFGVVAKLKLKVGDAFTVGCPVFLTAVDAQTVTSVDPGDGFHCGIYQGKAVAAAIAGDTGEVLVGARYSLGFLAV